MPAPTRPLVGMAPALFWSAGGETFEVDDPRFYGLLSQSGGSRQIWAYDFPYSENRWNADRTESVFSMFTVPPRLIDPAQPLIIDRPVYLYVADISDPRLLRQDWQSPQQYGFLTYDFSGKTYAGVLLSPNGIAAPTWALDPGHFITAEEFVTAAVVIWGGAFLAGAAAGGSAAGAVTVETGAAVTATETAAVAPAVAATTSASAGTGAAGAGAFSMADVMAGAKAVTQGAGVVSAIAKAVSQPDAISAPDNPGGLPPSNEQSLLIPALLVVGILGYKYV